MNLSVVYPASSGARRQAQLGPELGCAIETPEPGVSRGYPDIQPINSTFTSQLRREKLTPGFLEDSYPVCGSVRWAVLCPENKKHFVRAHKHSCHRPGCPQCWKSWGGRAARNAGDKIDGFDYSYAPRHIVLSPSPESIPYEDGNPKALTWLFDEGRKLCRNMGLLAVAAIAHSYRIIPQLESAVSELAAVAGDNRYVYAMKQDNWCDLVYYSPHLHLIVYGPLPKSDVVERATGWTYVNYDEDSPGRSGDELKQTIFYLLSHAWVRDNQNPVRYWFGLSSRQLGCTQAVDKVPVFCPVETCGVHIVKVPVPHSYQDIHNAPKYYRKMIRRFYWPKFSGRGWSMKRKKQSEFSVGD